jgi:hypothetical protein
MSYKVGPSLLPTLIFRLNIRSSGIVQWLTAIIPADWEAEIGRIKASPRAKK